MNTPNVRVGILSSKNIELSLNGDYSLSGEDAISGPVSLSARQVKEPLLLAPLSQDCSADVRDVTIGVNFHWQRQETQRFKGQLQILPHQGELVLINILPVEDYLESVISSEMSATSQLELLKAHAVISRSWLLAQMRKDIPQDDADDSAETPERRVRWYCHDDHALFDVCADDHCQRYQGITRQSTSAVAQAVKATAGQVLMYGDELCDARFSKCCGGVMEQFEYCWQPVRKPYLMVRRDAQDEMAFPDLRDHAAARKWILGNPEAFCNTDDKSILRQVLNGYDQETADFYRWRVEYTTEEISELVARRSGIDFGTILDLEPVERGTSGRISLLKIVGTKRTMEIGKELEIRRTLSETHLYSSAFVVEKTDAGFVLHGAGWGHGVGLCQIGAAVMAAKGYDYRQILQHYYPGSNLQQQ